MLQNKEIKEFDIDLLEFVDGDRVNTLGTMYNAPSEAEISHRNDALYLHVFNQLKLIKLNYHKKADELTILTVIDGINCTFSDCMFSEIGSRSLDYDYQEPLNFKFKYDYYETSSEIPHLFSNYIKAQLLKELV